MTDRPGFLRRNLWVLITATVLVAACIGAGLQQMERSRGLDAQSGEIVDLERRLATARVADDEAAEANTYEALGVTKSRLAADRAVIDDVLVTAFTWDDGKSYEAARADLVDSFGLDEKGPFLTEFMPPATRTVVDRTSQYYIDAVGLVFSLGEDVDVDSTRVIGTDYEYAVVADIDVSSSNVLPGSDGATPTETRRMLLRITVDGEGEVTALTGVPPSERTQSS
ncbi:hypothetical protein [Nocardiopsis sp. JB363]|uniref:hypothetical protein n=1 Tax=Nocardiopsis sp. JB363 TaxID=1434837 RepID=UPI0011815669|nr:hypothetical protein [Nocardiopsis sp. JB363]